MNFSPPLKKFFFLICMMMIFLAIFLGFNSYNCLTMWMSMEVTLMAYIPYIISNMKLSDGYASLKYFMFQCLGSTLFLFGFLEFYFFEMSILGLFLKLGIFPNHFWVLSISKSLNWLNFFLLMSFQKLLPLYFLLFFIPLFFYFLVFFLMLNSFFSNLSSINQLDMRFLLVFSSMNHMTWMIFSSILSMMIFLFYFSCYFFMLWLLTSYLSFNNVYYFCQLFSMNNTNYLINLFLMNFLFLSFLGFPPFLGFFIKMSSIFFSLNIFSFYWVLFLLIMNMFLSFSYSRIFFYLMINSSRSVIEEVSYIFFYSFFFLILFF